jgi:hypothetical protein
MGNAIWLFFALPDWYFSTILAPFSTGVLTVVPAVGIVALAVGAAWGVAKRRLGLSAFLVLPAASQALVVVAGFMRGTVGNAEVIIWTFLLLQAVAAGYFVFRLKGARLPASALAVFALSYAFFASFVASMAFSDVWV